MTGIPAVRRPVVFVKHADCEQADPAVTLYDSDGVKLFVVTGDSAHKLIVGAKTADQVYDHWMESLRRSQERETFSK